MIRAVLLGIWDFIIRISYPPPLEHGVQVKLVLSPTYAILLEDFMQSRDPRFRGALVALAALTALCPRGVGGLGGFGGFSKPASCM